MRTNRAALMRRVGAALLLLLLPTCVSEAHADSPAQVTTAPGKTASYALGVQGVTGGVAVPVSLSGVPSHVVSPPTVSTASTVGTCVSVTTTNNILAANANRHGFAISTRCANTHNARLAFDTTATTSQEDLAPCSIREYDNTTYQGPVSVVSDDGSTSITVCKREW